MFARGARVSFLTLRSYISREYFLSFVVSFLFFIAIFFVNQMLYLARSSLSQNVGIIDTLRLILYAMPAIVALSFPFGSLLGILMTVGKFSADNEMLALQASGVGLHRLFLPLVVISLGLSGFSFIMNDYFLPLGTLRYTSLYQELLYANSELALMENTVQQYERTTIITGSSSGGVFFDTMLIDTAEDGKNRVITAEEVRIVRNARQDGVISLELSGVEIHETDPSKPRDFTVVTSDTMVYSILLRELTTSIRNPGPREMSSLDVWDMIGDRQATLDERWLEADRSIAQNIAEAQILYMQETPAWLRGQNPDTRVIEDRIALIEADTAAQRTDRTIQLYRIELWKKIAIPIACFTFLILGFPIGLSARHNGRAVGFGFGVLFSVMYWGMLLGAETFGSRFITIDPALIMFAPNVLMIVAGVIVYAVRTKR